jgi:hypothetical protein
MRNSTNRTECGFIRLTISFKNCFDLQNMFVCVGNKKQTDGASEHQKEYTPDSNPVLLLGRESQSTALARSSLGPAEVCKAQLNFSNSTHNRTNSVFEALRAIELTGLEETTKQRNTYRSEG